MTPDAYRARVKAMGLTPCRPSNGSTTLHQTRDKDFVQVPDPEMLQQDEREHMLDLIQWRLTLQGDPPTPLN